MTRTDHGYPVDESRRCEAVVKGGRRCKNPPLEGRPFCALHGGQVAERDAERARLLRAGRG